MLVSDYKVKDESMPGLYTDTNLTNKGADWQKIELVL